MLKRFDHTSLIMRIASSERASALLICAIGVLARLAWLAARGHVGSSLGEAENVALSFAKTSTISDPFGRGSGLTAHLNPVLPALAGNLYKIFGVQSVTAEATLCAISLLFVFGSALFLYRTFRICGSSRLSCTIALAIFALIPLNYSLEVLEFRVWEGALAAFLLSAALCTIVTLEQKKTVSWIDIAGVAILAAFALFMNPAAGLTVYSAAALFLVTNMRLQRAIGSIVIAAAALIVVLTPWAVRNYLVFDKVIILRSNAGLELALANHAGLQSGKSDREVFVDRLHQIHPLASQAAFDAMQASGGEKAYADHLGREAMHWIGSHPRLAALQSIKHLRQYFFPPSWQWAIYSRSSKAVEMRVAVFDLISLLGLSGAIAAFAIWRGRWIYPAIFATLPCLPYMVTQPVPRYRYLVYGTLLFLAVHFLVWLAQNALPDRKRLARM